MGKPYRRTLKGLRADRGNMRQKDVAKELGINSPAYTVIEQFVDDPSTADAIGKLFGVKIEVNIVEAEQ